MQCMEESTNVPGTKLGMQAGTYQDSIQNQTQTEWALQIWSLNHDQGLMMIPGVNYKVSFSPVTTEVGVHTVIGVILQFINEA